MIFFLILVSIFLTNLTNLLCLAEFVSWHLQVTHGHFHGHQCVTAWTIFLQPHFWKVAVTTATWQVCQCCQVLSSLHCHIHLKPRPFWDLSRPHINNFSAAQDFKAQKHWNPKLGEGSWLFFLFWIPVFNEKLNKFARFSYICIMAPPTHSRPLSRPPISRGPNLFFTATFVESGRDNGHLASLNFADFFSVAYGRRVLSCHLQKGCSSSFELNKRLGTIKFSKN